MSQVWRNLIRDTTDLNKRLKYTSENDVNTSPYTGPVR